MLTRTTRRSTLAVGVTTGTGALLVACGAPATTAPEVGTPRPSGVTTPGTPAAQGSTAGGTLNYAEAGDFNDFNPWAFTAVNFELYNQVFSRLAWKDGDGKANADLAESWTLALDSTSLRLKLRADVKWHDGKPFSAQDYVEMFGYLKDETLSRYLGVTKIKGLLAPVKDVQAPDATTLEILFTGPVPYALDVLDYWYAIRIEDKSDPGMLKKPPVGTGPFKLAEWQPNQFARFTRFADYHQKPSPPLNEFLFKRLTQAETLLPNLKSGTLDGVLMTSLGDIGPLQADKSYTVDVNENAGSIFNIIVNSGKPPLDKKEVRQALSYSLNRAELAKSAFFGISRPITSTFYSKSSLAYRDDLLMAHAFDLNRAKGLLDGAGARDLELSIVVTPAWPQMKLFALVWQADLAKIGVRLKLNEVENAKFYEINGARDLQGNDLQAWLNARTTRDPAIFWNTQANYRGTGTTSFGYVNEEQERMIAAAAGETDQARRQQMYQQLNTMLIDSSHVIAVATNPRVWAYGKGVKDVRVDLNGNLILDRASIAR